MNPITSSKVSYGLPEIESNKSLGLRSAKKHTFKA